MNVITGDTYSINGVEIKWHKTFGEVNEALLQMERFDMSKIFSSWELRKFKCPEIFGMPTNECTINAPYNDRPVLWVDYQLKPMQLAPSDELHSPYIRHLLSILGEPHKVFKDYKRAEELKAYRWGAVVYYAEWKVEKITLRLTVYGDIRKQDSGLAAAELSAKLDELVAAEPYLEEKYGREQKLKAIAEDANMVTIFKLDQRQYGYPRYREPQSFLSKLLGRSTANSALYDAKMALYKKSLFHTPKALSKKLQVSDVALYYSTLATSWLISTKFLTVTLNDIDQTEYLYTNLLKGRGPGRQELKIEELIIEDAPASKSLFRIIDKLEKELETTIKRVEYYDE